jgi:hypothetical protein
MRFGMCKVQLHLMKVGDDMCEAALRGIIWVKSRFQDVLKEIELVWTEIVDEGEKVFRGSC